MPSLTGIKTFYKDILSSKSLMSSMRYCLVYYVTLLPGLLIYGLERIKDTTIGIAYFSSLTGILTALLGFKVRQFGKEVGNETNPIPGTGKEN